jgi:hypothetical protein
VTSLSVLFHYFGLSVFKVCFDRKDEMFLKEVTPKQIHVYENMQNTSGDKVPYSVVKYRHFSLSRSPKQLV